MDFLKSALEALPGVASSPLSLIGYALIIGAWVYTYNRSANLKILIKQIALIPESDRKPTVVATLGDPLPDNISAEQWIISKRQQYFLVAFIISLAVILIITAIALFQGAEKAAAQEAARARIAICERQLQDATDQRNRNKDELNQRIATINDSIGEWRLEERRGAAGLAFAPPDQKQLALDIINSAQAKISELEKERKATQSQLDNLAAMPPVPVSCG